MNASSNFLNINERTLYYEDDDFLFIDTPIIEINFYNDYIHILYDRSNRDINIYLVFKFIG